MIGYIPTLFYCNIFAFAFLQIKAKTKVSDSKAEKDEKIGLSVVVAVFFFYFLYYLPLFIGNFFIENNDDDNRKRIVGTFNASMNMPSAFVSRQFNLFDLVYMLNCVSNVAQAVVLLQFARENLLVCVEEHVNQKLSKTLDWKNRGMPLKKKNKRRTGG